ncbi:MAG: 3-oxoadipate CoA-transferase subunit B [Anaerolineae bacterium]|nr:MAG: 3-oxoadipate CoA-transferase subunit B [Anaerolineae bacterium]
MTQITPDEIMVVCMARQIRDGDIVAQGIATPLVAAAYLLARHTHAPHLYFASANGQSICRDPAPLSISKIENLWLDKALTHVGFVRAAADILPTLKPKEFFRPAQVDRYGNFNNVALGKELLTRENPKIRLRLPGTGGIPDVTSFISDIYLYVPRHSKVTFVEKIDLCSGLGHSPTRKRGQGAVYLISDLGQFDFQDGTMRLISLHPGITIEQVQRHTGFSLNLAPDIRETPLPTDQELHLLRHQIDPLGIRRLELMSGAERREFLLQILEQEMK